MGEEEREGLIALHSFCFFFRGSEPCRGRHEAHPSEAGSGWLQPLVGAAKCESEQPEQRTTCQAAMAGGKAPRQKPGLHNPRQHFLHARLSRAMLPAARLQQTEEAHHERRVPQPNPVSPSWGRDLVEQRVGTKPRRKPARRFCSPAPGGDPSQTPPCLLDQAEGRCSHRQEPGISSRCFVHPVSSCCQDFP